MPTCKGFNDNIDLSDDEEKTNQLSTKQTSNSRLVTKVIKNIIFK
jgi:hypothetical protein